MRGGSATGARGKRVWRGVLRARGWERVGGRCGTVGGEARRVRGTYGR